MKHEKLMRAMGEIDEDLILEAHEVPKRAKTVWIRWAACAACFALLVIAVPRVVEMTDGAMSRVEADMEFDIFGDAAEKADCIEAPGLDEIDGEADNVAGVPTENANTGSVPSTSEMLLLALEMQGGVAYPIGTTVETKHGSVVLTDRVGETVAMRVTLSRNEQLVIYSATAGVWRLTINGESTETLPDRAGTYEIVLDFSGDPTLDMIFIENFGVFSISDW